MRLLDRYVLRELLVPLCYCLAGLLLLWITSDLFANLADLQQEKKLLAGDIVEYYLVQIPEVIVLIAPFALLVSLLYALTNHARHQEITAMRAAGLSLWRVAAPYFVVGLIFTVMLFVVNEFVVPRSVDAAEQVRRRRVPAPPGSLARNEVRNLGFTNARDGRIWQIGLYDNRTGQMSNPQVIWKQSDGSRLWIRAERALPAQGGGWTFYDVHQYRESGVTNSLVPLGQTNVARFPEFNETPDLIRSEISLSRAITLRGAKKADIPLEDIFDYLRLHPHPSRTDSMWLYTKLQGRLAAPWTCLVVVLIALPFGAPSGRRNVFVGVASSIVICFSYFVLQQFGLALGTGGYLPPWLAAWAPNLSFGLAGIVMTSRVR